MTNTIQEFDYSVNLLKALIWQYNEATNLQSLLQQKQDWYDTNQTQFWTDWYNNVFNLETANEFGCAVWAIILGIPISAIVPPTSPQPTWGFGGFNQNFTNGNFSNTGSSVVSLTLEQQRLILQLRYYQLTSNGTVPLINAMLKSLFGSQGVAYVLDGLDMTCEYVFTFQPSSEVLFVLEQFDLLPRPAGVGIRLTILGSPIFGFGQYNENFNNGNYY